MRRTLFLAAAATVAVAALPAGASAQTGYAICDPGFIPNPQNFYYCIPDNGETPTPRKKPHLSLKVLPRKDKSAPIRYRASGRLSSLKGVSRFNGCKGRVRVTVKRGRKSVLRTSTRVRRNCTYAVRLKIAGAKLRQPTGKLRVKARFAGNDRLKPAVSRTRTVKYAE